MLPLPPPHIQLNASNKPARRIEGEASFVTNDVPRPFWEFAWQVAKEVDYLVKLAEIIQLLTLMAYVIDFIAE